MPYSELDTAAHASASTASSSVESPATDSPPLPATDSHVLPVSEPPASGVGVEERGSRAVPMGRGEPGSSGGAESSTPANGGGEQPGGGDGAAEGLYDLGYLTEGVASYIASLRERVSRTQADLLTVPAQELRSALQVCPKALLLYFQILHIPSGVQCTVAKHNYLPPNTLCPKKKSVILKELYMPRNISHCILELPCSVWVGRSLNHGGMITDYFFNKIRAWEVKLQRFFSHPTPFNAQSTCRTQTVKSSR